jgi:hypothetical protein
MSNQFTDYDADENSFFGKIRVKYYEAPIESMGSKVESLDGAMFFGDWEKLLDEVPPPPIPESPSLTLFELEKAWSKVWDDVLFKKHLTFIAAKPLRFDMLDKPKGYINDVLTLSWQYGAGAMDTPLCKEINLEELTKPDVVYEQAAPKKTMLTSRPDEKLVQVDRKPSQGRKVLSSR